jgi:DNA-binding XRE family transcriptional regulator
VRVADRTVSGPVRRARPMAIEAGRCARCGAEKSWLRPGEVCAPCRAPLGAPTRRPEEEDEEPAAVPPTAKGVEMETATETRACQVCAAAFEPTTSRQVNCSRACTVKAADRRRAGRPVADAPQENVPTPVESEATPPRKRRGGRKPGTWSLEPQAFWDWRVGAKLSRATVGKLLRVSPTSVQNWESGHATPSTKHQLAIAQLMASPRGGTAVRAGSNDLEDAGRELGAALGRFLAALRSS